jgi:hypothetical protein
MLAAVLVIVPSVVIWDAFRRWFSLQERRRIDARVSEDTSHKLAVIEKRIAELEVNMAKVLTQVSTVQGGFAAARRMRMMGG